MAQEVIKKECSKIEDKERLVVFKLSSLWKHGDKKNVLIVVSRLYKVGESYMNKGFVHAKNKHLYIVYYRDIIITSKLTMLPLKREKKIGSIFCLFSHVNWK